VKWFVSSVKPPTDSRFAHAVPFQYCHWRLTPAPTPAVSRVTLRPRNWLSAPIMRYGPRREASAGRNANVKSRPAWARYSLALLVNPPYPMSRGEIASP
jgi:hypothetical protein